MLIRTEAIGANFVDTKFRRGAGGIFQGTLPGKITGDVMGTVDSVGPDIDQTLVGTRVGTLVYDAFADYAIDYSKDDWVERVREAAPNGVDLVAESIGGVVFGRSIELLAPLGRLVIYGLASGEMPTIPIRELYGLKSVAGFSLLGFRAAAPEQSRKHTTELAEYAAAGKLRTSVHATYLLTEAAKVHQILENREHLGRVLVVP